MEETNTPKPKRHYAVSKKIPTKPLIGVAIVVALVGAGFYGGVAYQKSKQPVAATNTGQFGQDGVASGAFRRRSSETVTAVSGSSITVKSSSGTSKTYSITSSTEVIKDGSVGSIADIATGDTVRVMSTDGTTASRIIAGQMMQPGSGMMPNIDQNSLQTN